MTSEQTTARRRRKVPAVERMFDAECRVETLIWIPGIGTEDSFTEAFSVEFYDYMPEREGAPLYAQLPMLAQFCGDEDVEPERIAYAIQRVPGFLVQAATPVRRYMGDKGVFVSGWGYYHTEWLYARTEAQIAKVCLAWAKQSAKADKAKAAS